jgi:chromosome condensin MukBEF MukE localization factor
LVQQWSAENEAAIKLQKQLDSLIANISQYSYVAKGVLGDIAGLVSNRRMMDELIRMKEEAFDPKAVEQYSKAIKDLQREYQNLWQSIMDNVGSILIMVGSQIGGYVGAAMVIAGAGIEIGGLIKDGREQSKAFERAKDYQPERNFRFHISGPDLAATYDSNMNYQRLVT